MFHNVIHTCSKADLAWLDLALQGTSAVVQMPVCSAGGVNIPHPAKADTGGEDAFFISRGAVGVADGVSAWAREGVNAALYSS